MIVNPTTEQRRSLTGIVYVLRNKINNKVYVGQSYTSFKERYNLGETWWKKVNSPILGYAIKKYGHKSFEISFVEWDIKDRDELNKREEAWAIKLNSYHPFGYNFNPCGKESVRLVSPEYQANMAKKNAKHYRIKEIATGKIHEVFNLSEFCRQKQLDVANLHHALKNRGLYFKGFCSPETTDADLKNARMLRFEKDLYAPFYLVKDGAEFVVNDCREFMTEHKLCCSDFMALLKGTKENYKGFRLKPKRTGVP